jgi:hypothetical protein
VYLCKKVISEFNKGSFTQTLEGGLYMYPIPSKTNTANPAAANSGTAGDPNQSAAETNRLANAGTGGSTRPSAGAGQSSPSFAATDPRRVDGPDGGSAAILGSQQNSAARAAPVVSTGGPGTAVSGPLSGAAFNNSTTRPVGASAPATNADGTVIATPTATGNVPPKIANNTSPTSPTQPANQPMALDS